MDASVPGRDLELARSAVGFWVSSMYEVLRSETLRLHLAIEEPVLRRIVVELAAAAARIKLHELIGRELAQVSHVELFDQHVAKACVIVEL